ncbi:MAG: hypothetical protein Q9207_005323 [Kuettlingeria erythrocarpa]
MPRTIYPPDPRWVGDPRWTSESHLRACAEEFHHEVLHRLFALPPQLSQPRHISSSEKETQLSRGLSFRAYNTCQAKGAYLSQLKPNDAKIFCWKDCAVYSLKTKALQGADHFQLLDRGYKAWFPRRSADRDVSDGNFWGIHVMFRHPADEVEGCEDGDEGAAKQVAKAGELAQMWRFHDVFCEHLKGLAEVIEESKAGKWGVRESFTEVAMIVEAGWREEGVRLVWKDDPTLKYVGFAAEELWTVVEEAQGDFWVLWCPLERAIRIVASRDPERRGGRREEWNEQYEDMLADGEADGDDSL